MKLSTQSERITKHISKCPKSKVWVWNGPPDKLEKVRIWLWAQWSGKLIKTPVTNMHPDQQDCVDRRYLTRNPKTWEPLESRRAGEVHG